MSLHRCTDCDDTGWAQGERGKKPCPCRDFNPAIQRKRRQQDERNARKRARAKGRRPRGTA